MQRLYRGYVREGTRSLQQEPKPLTPRPRARFADEEAVSPSPPPPDVIPVKTNSKEQQGESAVR